MCRASASTIAFECSNRQSKCISACLPIFRNRSNRQKSLRNEEASDLRVAQAVSKWPMPEHQDGGTTKLLAVAVATDDASEVGRLEGVWAGQHSVQGRGADSPQPGGQNSCREPMQTVVRCGSQQEVQVCTARFVIWLMPGSIIASSAVPDSTAKWLWLKSKQDKQ